MARRTAVRLRGQGGLAWRALPALRLLFRAAGRSWNDFYAWMLDRQERANSIDSIIGRGRSHPGADKGLYDLSRGRYHAEYLKRHGLRPEHRLLDIGCGYGRTAVAVLPYLEPGHYIGTELSRQRLRLARELVAREGLCDRDPRFVLSIDNAMPELDAACVDVIWAQSVFTHMPREEAHMLLAACRRVLVPGGRMLFNYASSPDDAVHERNVKDFCYPDRVMAAMVRSAGFALEVMDDWQDDLQPQHRARHNRMLKLTARD